jgi:rRNA small subunit pseudouridine methyltransferase Nep1
MINHPSVKRNAKRKGKKPKETILDRSIHHFGMQKLINSQKRGRPDIIHICLLLALDSPLNKKGRLKTIINTLNGYSIEVNPKTRPPKDYNRFISLMEHLLIDGKVPVSGKEFFFKLKKQSLQDLVFEINPSKVIALTSHGEYTSFSDFCKPLTNEKNPVVLIGAYPSGPMEPNTLKLADEQISVYQGVLESWTITSRLVYEYEKNMEL